MVSAARVSHVVLSAALLAIVWTLVAGAAAGGLLSVEGRVTGSVIDSLSARPIRYALVTVVGSRANALTDSLGRYLIERCPTGPQTIRATAMGYDPATRPLTIRGGLTDSLRLRPRRLDRPVRHAVRPGVAPMTRVARPGSPSRGFDSCGED
jgi:hypothetical protein